MPMKIIKKKPLVDFYEKHADAKSTMISTTVLKCKIMAKIKTEKEYNVIMSFLAL